MNTRQDALPHTRRAGSTFRGRSALSAAPDRRSHGGDKTRARPVPEASSQALRTGGQAGPTGPYAQTRCSRSPVTDRRGDRTAPTVPTLTAARPGPARPPALLTGGLLPAGRQGPTAEQQQAKSAARRDAPLAGGRHLPRHPAPTWRWLRPRRRAGGRIPPRRR